MMAGILDFYDFPPFDSSPYDDTRGGIADVSRCFFIPNISGPRLHLETRP